MQSLTIQARSVLVTWRSYTNDHKNPRPYGSTLRDFARWSGVPASNEAAAVARLIALDYAGALGYKKSMIDRRLSANTVNLRLAVLRGFCRELVAAGVLARNPFDRVRPLKGSRLRGTRALPLDHVRDFINAGRDLQERAMFSALIGGALRRSECARLLISDVRERDGVVYLFLQRTKNGNDYDQALAPWAAEAVNAWKLKRLADGARPADPLFVSHYGGNHAFNDQSIYRRVLKACERAGINPDGIGAHSCRATAVTLLLSQGVDRRAVKDFGRFSSYGMIDVYDKRAFSLADHAGLKLVI